MDYKSLKASEVTEGVTMEYSEIPGVPERLKVTRVMPSPYDDFVHLRLEGIDRIVTLSSDTLINTWHEV